MSTNPSYIVLHSAYLNYCQGNHCAAKLLRVILRWSDWKGQNSPTNSRWFFQTQKQFRDEILGEHGIDAIRHALKLLIQLELVQRRRNPFNQQDRTYQYQIHPDRFEELKQALNISAEKSASQTASTALEADQSASKAEKAISKADKSLNNTTIYKTTDLDRNHDQKHNNSLSLVNEKKVEQKEQIDWNMHAEQLSVSAQLLKQPLPIEIEELIGEDAECRQLCKEILSTLLFYFIEADPPLLKLIAHHASQNPSRLQSNLKAALVYLSHSAEAKNPLAIVKSAIQKNWEPTPGKSVVIPGFKEYLDYARKIKFLLGSTVTESGMVRVFSEIDSWYWPEFAAIIPMQVLQQLMSDDQAEQESAIAFLQQSEQTQPFVEIAQRYLSIAEMERQYANGYSPHAFATQIRELSQKTSLNAGAISELNEQ